MPGKVWMVGVGPGDPELITVRGTEVLSRAEVVVYDETVNPEYLESAPDGAEVFNAGRQPTLHAMTEREIAGLLIQRAGEGKNVVRLLGGDPFVFGPGVGEALALAAAGVPFEIVPGVTSTVAAPAYAGIPVLHPDLARSYAVVAGDAAGTAPESLINWDRLATAVDTLVFPGAVENLPALVARLLDGGRSPQTPVAVVGWGTDARQATIVGTLADIAARVEAAALHAPAITVVGDVVRLREQLRWYDDRPLFGRRVLLARTRHGASAIKRLLQSEGAEVVELPTHEVVEAVAPEIIGRVVEALAEGQYGWVIFSSERAVEMFFRHLAGLGRDARTLHAAQIVATGGDTAEALTDHGIIADVLVEDPTPEALLTQLRARNLSRRRVLLPRAEARNQDLLLGLRRAGGEVEDVPLYVASVPRQPNREALDRLQRREIDAIVFPASTAVTNFIKMLGDGVEPLRSVTVACIGPLTADAARRAGLRVDVVAEPATPAGVVRGLRDYLARAGGIGVVSPTA